MSNTLIIEQVGPAIVVRFSRPEIRSPLSVEVLDELANIVTDLASYAEIRKIIFTGVGEVFASGADLREIAKLENDGVREFARRGQDLMRGISDLPVETIAAVNGICFGGALDLALACRRRIASPNAVFSHPGADLGIMTGWGGTQRLPRLIGEGRALEMFFTAKRVTADEALISGLVDEVAEDVVKRALDT
jgi:enoyl-CoA hydratase